jgi:CBS domain-containing protein
MLIESLRHMMSARLTVTAVDATLRNAASALSNPHTGNLVACDGHRKVAGVVSKSDLVRHLSFGGAEAPVSEPMSRNISACRP